MPGVSGSGNSGRPKRPTQKVGLDKGVSDQGVKKGVDRSGFDRKARQNTRMHLSKGLNRAQLLELDCIVCPKGSHRQKAKRLLNRGGGHRGGKVLSQRQTEAASSGTAASSLPLVPIPQERDIAPLDAPSIEHLSDLFDNSFSPPVLDQESDIEEGGEGGGFDFNDDSSGYAVDPSALAIVPFVDNQQIQEHGASIRDLLLHFKGNQEQLLQDPDQVNVIYSKICDLMDTDGNQVVEFIKLYASNDVDADFRGVMDSMLTAYFEGERRDVMQFLRQTIETSPVSWFQRNPADLFLALKIGQADLLRESMFSHDLAEDTDSKVHAMQWFRVFSGGDQEFADTIIRAFVNLTNSNALPVEVRNAYANLQLKMATSAFTLVDEPDLHALLFTSFEKALPTLPTHEQVASIADMLLTVAQIEGKGTSNYKKSLEIVTNYADDIRVEYADEAAKIDEKVRIIKEGAEGSRSVVSSYLWTGLKITAGVALLVIVLNGGTFSAPLHQVNPYL